MKTENEIFHDVYSMRKPIDLTERNLADFFNNAVVGLHWVDADGVILTANRAELELVSINGKYMNKNILVIEDDANIAASLQELLEKKGILLRASTMAK